MKLLDHDVQSVRIIALAKRLVSLPAVWIIGICRWMKAGCGMATDKQVREKDQLRQSRVRRQLRGLPPDHKTSEPA